MNNTKRYFLIYIAILVAGTIASYFIAQNIYCPPYDWESQLPASILPLLIMCAALIGVIYIKFRNKVNFREQQPTLMGVVLIGMISFFGTSALYVHGHLFGYDPSDVKSYQNVWQYNKNNNEKVIKLNFSVLNPTGLCHRSIIKLGHSGRSGRRTPPDTTTYFAMPIVRAVDDATIEGWFLGKMPTRIFEDIYQRQSLAELVDFPNIKCYMPVDLKSDYTYAGVVNRSSMFNSTAADKPALYASYTLPDDKRHFFWYATAGYVLAVLGLWWAAKITSDFESLLS